MQFSVFQVNLDERQIFGLQIEIILHARYGGIHLTTKLCSNYVCLGCYKGILSFALWALNMTSVRKIVLIATYQVDK